MEDLRHAGYSLDNLAPGVSQGFMVTYSAPGGNQLAWGPSEDGETPGTALDRRAS